MIYTSAKGRRKGKADILRELREEGSSKPDDETAVYFHKQPEGDEETAAAQRAMEICPTLAIGNDG